MKKTLLFASMAALSLSAAAQALDPATYEVKEGVELTSLWMMSAGNNENGVAMADWKELSTHFANAGKATTATICGDYVYIACSTQYVDAVDEQGQPFQELTDNGHIVVLDAATGKFVKDLNLTVDGVQYEGLLCCNSIGTDDFGHLWICGYVETFYDTATGATRPFNLYLVDTETGALTLVNSFELDEIDGPTAGKRVDYYDVIGNLVGDADGAAFLAIPNQEALAALLWVKYPDCDYWDCSDASQYAILLNDTYPAGQTNWAYSPMGSFVRTEDGSFEGSMFWIDGHPTNPALYDTTGEMLTSHKLHQGDAPSEDDPVGGPWANFLPSRQANGMRQFSLAGSQYLAYAMFFPDNTNMGGHMAIVKLDSNDLLDEATPLWLAPAGMLGINKGEGRFSHSIVVTDEYTDDAGKCARNILLYKDMNGIALYRMAEEGFNAGVTDIISDANADAPVEYFNLNGVRCNNNLVPGVYITRQGTTVNKVIVK